MTCANPPPSRLEKIRLGVVACLLVGVVAIPPFLLLRRDPLATGLGQAAYEVGPPLGFVLGWLLYAADRKKKGRNAKAEPRGPQAAKTEPASMADAPRSASPYRDNLLATEEPLPPDHFRVLVDFAPRLATIKMDEAARPNGLAVEVPIATLRSLRRYNGTHAPPRKETGQASRILHVKHFPEKTLLGDADEWGTENTYDHAQLEELLAFHDAGIPWPEGVTRIIARGQGEKEKQADGGSEYISPALERVAGNAHATLRLHRPAYSEHKNPSNGQPYYMLANGEAMLMVKRSPAP